jgi:hypothetical protein
MFGHKKLERIYGPPDIEESYLNLTNRLAEVGSQEPERLKELLEALHNRFPLSHNARLLLFRGYSELDLKGEAFKHLATALALYPESPLLLQTLLSAIASTEPEPSVSVLAKKKDKMEARARHL